MAKRKPAKKMAKKANRAVRGEWIKLDPPERKRVYHYSKDENIQFIGVTRIMISASGNHYIETAGGSHNIVAPGWRAIMLDIDEWTF